MAIERGDTIYRYNGQYYTKSDAFSGTYRQISPGSSGKSLIANKLVTVNDLDDSTFKPEPSSKSQIRQYYEDRYSYTLQDLTRRLNAGEITEMEAIAREKEAKVEVGNNVDQYWAEREAEKFRQESGIAAREAQRLAAGGGSGGSSGPRPSTGDPGLDEALSGLEDYLNQLEARGQVLNPNVQLDSKILAKFTEQAEKEIDPYYKTQLKLARDSLTRDLNYSAEQLGRDEQDLERTYQKQVRTIGENSAEQGFALSGQRQRSERDLALDTQNTIENNRRQLSFNAGNAVGQYARQYGSENLPETQIGNTPTVGAGETGFGKANGTRQLYSISPNVYAGLVGSNEFERRTNVKNRSSQLEQAFRANQGLTQQRSLTL